MIKEYCNLEEFEVYVEEYLELLQSVNGESVKVFEIETGNEEYIKLVYTDLASDYIEALSFEVCYIRYNDMDIDVLVYIKPFINRIKTLREVLSF